MKALVTGSSGHLGEALMRTHSATLHKVHVATHSKAQFLETNIRGTLALLEEAQRAEVRAFVFTSTTSVFGDAMRPAPGEPAAWITEATTPRAKNIYGATKLAAAERAEAIGFGRFIISAASALAQAVGSKGYHSQTFSDGP